MAAVAQCSLRNRISGWRWRPRHDLLLLLVVSLPVFTPFVTVGAFETADGRTHLMRLVAFDQLLRGGVWYPRWAPDLVGGYGLPVFNFYAPSTYFLAEAFHLLGANFYAAMYLMSLTLMVVGGCGAYWLARDVLDVPDRPAGPHWPALVAATAFVYSPYLLSNTYGRGAYGETAAQTLMPWILWAFRRLLTEPRPARYVVPAAVALAGLALSHNITLLFFPPVLLAYLAVVWWQLGRPRAPIKWVVVAGAAALGLSAFFWVPLLLERGYLNPRFFAIAHEWMQINFWAWPDWHAWNSPRFSAWPSFLNAGLVGNFNFGYQLYLAQIMLAAAGFAWARRRTAEWWFMAAAVVGLCLSIFRFAQPLWEAVPALTVVQFPWRLLTIINLFLALFIGGLATRAVHSRRQPALGGLLLAVIVVTHAPRSALLKPQDAVLVPLYPATVAQFERETGALGVGSSLDFLLRWTDLTTSPFNAIEAEGSPPGPDRVRVVAASALGLEMEVESEDARQLRLASIWYPAWQAVTGSGQTLRTYPTTNLGLLTVDVPAGRHRVQVTWEDAPALRWATLASLMTLAGLAALASQHGQRWAAGGLALVLAVGSAGAVASAPTAPLTPPSQAFAFEGLELAGLRVRSETRARLAIEPFWYVRAPLPDLVLGWALIDAQGQPVAEARARPNYAAQSTRNWVAGMLVDDDYVLDLPPGLPAGLYQLAVQAESAEQGTTASSRVSVTTVSLDVAVPSLPPVPPALYRLGDDIGLHAVDLTINGRPAPNEAWPAVRGGDNLVYTLQWSAARSLLVNYHSFIHLQRSGGGLVVKLDQLAGSNHNPSLLWDPYHLHADVYRYRVPSDLPGGLYTPQLGLYPLSTVETLPAWTAEGEPLEGRIELPPIKVVNPPVRPPQRLVTARFGDFAELWGYDLALPPDELRPGSTLTLTLYYRSLAPTSAELIQFVHLYDAAAGQLAAQLDAQPQAGANPTWSWRPGEVVVDRLTLMVAEEAPPGRYVLKFGLYDPALDQRSAVSGGDPARTANNEVILDELSIGP